MSHIFKGIVHVSCIDSTDWVKITNCKYLAYVKAGIVHKCYIGWLGKDKSCKYLANVKAGIVYKSYIGWLGKDKKL